MSVLYPLFFEALLVTIIYQDFRHRSLSMYVLAISLITAIGYSIIENGWAHALAYAGINLFLIGIQLVGITLYFSVKKKTFVNIINTYFGSGDVWFYAVVAFCFSPLNFVLFNLAACFAILIIYAAAGYAAGYSRTIPFAGCVAVLVFIMIGCHALHLFNVYDDYFLAYKVLGGIP